MRLILSAEDRLARMDQPWHGVFCYSAAAEMKLNKPKKRVQANKRVSTTDCNKVSNEYITFSHD